MECPKSAFIPAFTQHDCELYLLTPKSDVMISVPQCIIAAIAASLVRIRLEISRYCTNNVHNAYRHACTGERTKQQETQCFHPHYMGRWHKTDNITHKNNNVNKYKYQICLLSLLDNIYIFNRVVPDLTISNPEGAGARFGKNLFLDHRTIHLMKLMVSTLLSAAIQRQYHSVLPLLCYCLPVFDEMWGAVMNFVFLLFR